jgi:RpiR family transcriptional regulator, carbohydrate utilization regulator
VANVGKEVDGRVAAAAGRSVLAGKEQPLECLRDTIANLDEPQLQGAVTALAEARRILLLGTGAAAAICQLAQYRLSNIGVSAAWASDSMVMLSEVNQLGAADVLVGVSYSGRTRVTVELMEVARRRGVTTIALTAARNTPLAACADIPFVVFGPNVSVRSGQFSARVSGMVLLEALVTAVALQRQGDVMAGLEEFGEPQARINNLGPTWKPGRRHG